MKKYIQTIGKVIRSIPACITVLLFGRIFYDKKYLKTSWFSTLFSEGWMQAYRDIWHRIIYGKNIGIKWPCSPDIECGKNVIFEPEDLPNFINFGNHFQTYDAKIVLGQGTYIAKNVGIITSNHDFQNLAEHQKGKDVIIGKHCRIGMNSVILPGVILGDHTIVGAGAVVTHSFPDGYCIIGGNPARIIKALDISE